MNPMGRTAEGTPPHSPLQGIPAVLASSRVCEVMEMAAASLMRRDLYTHESSVAVRMDLRHVALPKGQTDPLASGKARVVATRVGIRGRLQDFRVDIFDETGLIASGDHTRAVVIERRVEALARRRSGRPSMLLSA
jgi:predicted thioesterase